jgi:hypothetical protein
MADNKLPSPTAAVFLLIVLLGFLLFILSVPEVDRQEFLKDRNKVSDETILLELDNIKIDGYEGYSRTNTNYDSFKWYLRFHQLKIKNLAYLLII